MVKRFLYMIAVAFALQMSWAVAGAYCLHETGRASEHFGHHQHEHTANQSPDQDSSSPSKKASVHTDCASCTHSPAGMFAWTVGFIEPLFADHSMAVFPSPQPEPYLGLPERPQWNVAA